MQQGVRLGDSFFTVLTLSTTPHMYNKNQNDSGLEPHIPFSGS